jgi:glycosyltransferase involved in cell wall biosynthesis
MKIGIVAPSPVPFVIGGAENLWAGMLAAFNQRAGIECELIKLPGPERNLVEVISSYRRFAQLDLNHFDLLISTKYPAWAVHHPNHTVYVQHKLRGLYDTYPAQLSTQINQAMLQRAGVPRELWPLLTEPGQAQNHKADARLSTLDIAQVATQLLDVVNSSDPALVAFPGPLSRAFIHLLDRIALQPSRIKRYAAISRTVSEREGYFPKGFNVEVMHHPSSLDVTTASVAQHFTDIDTDVGTDVDADALAPMFSASRLDAPKRIDMIVNAWLKAGSRRPLRIAGDGPERERLQRIANGNPGIQFLGRLTDEALAQEYARAAWVVFVPDREDYGLITVEAMAANKPVLTVADAGGVTELVEHGINGLIVASNAEALAQGMRQLDADAAARARMGEAAAARVADITWPGLINFFLGAHDTPFAGTASPTNTRVPAILQGARPRYIVVNTFQLTPVTSGGQVRLYGLYRALARYADVHFINLGSASSAHTVRELHPHLTEEVVPSSAAFMQAERDLRQVVNASVGDLAAALYPNTLPDWVRAISQSTRTADAVICSHPYGYPTVHEAGWQGKLVYEAHNVERDLKQGIYAGQPWPVGEIETLERNCARAASHITACSESERDRLTALYGLTAQQCAVIPNGIALDLVPYTSPSARASVQKRLGLRKPVALFMGSAHQPNVEAAELILQAAALCTEFDFALMGSVSHQLGRNHVPRNTRLLGVVNDTEKSLWLKVASIGLNPIISGAGTNLKLAEYAAAGLPIISTQFGARGGVLLPDAHLITHDQHAEALVDALQRWQAMSAQAREAMVTSAWQQVKAHLDWEAIAVTYADFLRS